MKTNNIQIKTSNIVNTHRCFIASIVAAGVRVNMVLVKVVAIPQTTGVWYGLIVMGLFFLIYSPIAVLSALISQVPILLYVVLLTVCFSSDIVFHFYL
jgi:hypothetical protein